VNMSRTRSHAVSGLPRVVSCMPAIEHPRNSCGASGTGMARARKLVSEEGPPVSPQLVRSIIGSSPIIHRSSAQAFVVFDLANCHAMIWFEVSAAMPQIPTLVVPIQQCV
jgi:hypothetical protein